MNQNGRIFIDTSTTPNKGVEIADMQSVFGISANDIGQIIDTADINKWAKYKPVRSGKLGILTDAERAELNHGIVLTKYTSPAALVSGYAGDYAYLKPRGMATYGEPYRVLDFNEYNNNAESPVSSFQGISGDVTEGTDLIVRLYLNPSNQVPTGSILWTDLNPGERPLSQYYFGVIIRTGTSSTYRVITMGTAIGTGYPIQELALTLPASLFAVGNSYTLYPILSYTAYTTATSQSSYTTGLFSVPGATPTTFSVRTIAVVVSYGIPEGGFTATMGAGRYYWSLTGVMQVNNGSPVTGEIDFRIYAGQDTSGEVVISGVFYYGQISVAPAVTSHTESGSRLGSNPGYLTAVLSYHGVDSLPVTTQVTLPE